MRIGNAAYGQHQLDVYGEVMDALYLARRGGLAANENAWRVQQALIGYLGDRLAGAGRRHLGGARPETPFHALQGDGLGRAGSVDQGGRAVRPAMARWSAGGRSAPRFTSRSAAKGSMRSWTPSCSTMARSDPDASLLLLPLVGFLPADDPRMVGTTRYIQSELLRDGFVPRYPTHAGVDGLPPGEGAFLLCTFWLADNLAMQGRTDEARELFERLLSLSNDVGLLSEEYDLQAQRLVGNFPQAFSHVGLINTAKNLSQAKGPSEDRCKTVDDPIARVPVDPFHTPVTEPLNQEIAKRLALTF